MILFLSLPSTVFGIFSFTLAVCLFLTILLSSFLVSVLAIHIFLACDLLTIFSLCFIVSDLVPNEVVQCQHRANERGKVHEQQLIVGLDCKCCGKLLQVEVGQEVEDILQLVEDDVVHWELPRHNFLEIVTDVFEVFLEALQGKQLATDALTERANCLILDVSGGEKEQCKVKRGLQLNLQRTLWDRSFVLSSEVV